MRRDTSTGKISKVRTPEPCACLSSLTSPGVPFSSCSPPHSSTIFNTTSAAVDARSPTTCGVSNGMGSRSRLYAMDLWLTSHGSNPQHRSIWLRQRTERQSLRSHLRLGKPERVLITARVRLLRGHQESEIGLLSSCRSTVRVQTELGGREGRWLEINIHRKEGRCFIDLAWCIVPVRLELLRPVFFQVQVRVQMILLNIMSIVAHHT